MRFRTLLLVALIALGSFQLAQASDPRVKPVKVTHKKAQKYKAPKKVKYKVPKQKKFKQKKFKKPKNHI